MHAFHPNRSILLPGIRRWCAFLLLTLYAFCATPLGAGCTAFLAEVDASHQVLVNEHHGQISIVLHHASGESAHAHGRLTQLLTIAASTKPGQSDHVINMAAEQESERCQFFQMKVDESFRLETSRRIPAIALPVELREVREFLSDFYLGIRSTLLLI